MIVAGFFTTILLPFLFGMSFLSVFFNEIEINHFLTFSLSSGLGLGVVALWIFVLGIFNLPMNPVTINGPILLVSISFLFKKRQTALRSNQIFFERLSFVEFFLLAVLIFYTAFTLLVNLFIMPITEWDAIATVAFKAKFFFFHQTFDFNATLPHPSYPLLTPLLMMWAAVNLDQWHEYLVKVIFFMFGMNLLFLVYGFLREFIERRYALLGAALMCVSNYFVFHSIIAYRDLSLAFYNCSAVILIILWKLRGKNHLLVLAGFFSGLAVFTKLEGSGYAFVHFLLVLYLSIVPFKQTGLTHFLKECGSHLLRFLLPVAIIFFSYFIFKLLNGVPLGEGGKTEVVVGVELLKRIPVIGIAFLKNFFGKIYWNWNWYLLTICFLMLWWKLRLVEQWLLLAIFLFLLADFMLFLLTPNYKYLLMPNLDMLLPRLVLHFFPLAPIVTVMMVPRILDEQ